MSILFTAMLTTWCQIANPEQNKKDSPAQNRNASKHKMEANELTVHTRTGSHVFTTENWVIKFGKLYTLPFLHQNLDEIIMCLLYRMIKHTWNCSARHKHKSSLWMWEVNGHKVMQHYNSKYQTKMAQCACYKSGIGMILYCLYVRNGKKKENHHAS